MLTRSVFSVLEESVQESPVSLLHGARQTGKSTLAHALVQSDTDRRYLTFDDATLLGAATTDPQGFIAGLPSKVVLDEVQRVPELFLAIKADVDRNRVAGKYLLTGSANVYSHRQLADSLAGRLQILRLWPLSEAEIEGKRGTFVDRVFAPDFSPSVQPEPADSITRRILRGGYPEAVHRTNQRSRSRWFESYLTTLLQRDIRDLADIEKLADLPRLLRLLATRACNLLNYSDVMRDLKMPATTLKRYVALLEAAFLFTPIPAWSNSLGKRLVKSPKVLLCDTGLLSHLIGLEEKEAFTNPTLFGSVVENFAILEVLKQSTWSDKRVALSHYRSHAGAEVDLVLEDAAGRTVGIEVKSSETLVGRDLRGLKSLAESLGDRFVRGVVLYRGRETVPFGKNLHAVPIPVLWEE
jgi:predicted AAA+ superfamily ATPase